MIELDGLQKVIDQQLVLDITHLTVDAGEIAAVVGPAGSGNDALLQLLIGRSASTRGSLLIGGVDPRANPSESSRLVGVVFADDALYATQSPSRYLAFHCRLFGLPRSRAADVLGLIGLADHGDAKMGKLSSGMMRRLAFGRALLHAPGILVVVDPFARCDAPSIALLIDLMRDLADQGTTVLILADDTAHLASLCDTIHTLERGQITDSYEPREEKQAELPFKIPVRLEGRVALINPGDILYVLAEQSRAFLQTTEERLPTQFTVSELEERLARSGFFRAHRAYLVNLQHVKEVVPYTRNSFTLVLDDADGTEIPLSKTAARELKELLGY